MLLILKIATRTSHITNFESTSPINNSNQIESNHDWYQQNYKTGVYFTAWQINYIKKPQISINLWHSVELWSHIGLCSMQKKKNIRAKTWSKWSGIPVYVVKLKSDFLIDWQFHDADRPAQFYSYWRIPATRKTELFQKKTFRNKRLKIIKKNYIYVRSIWNSFFVQLLLKIS